MLRIGSHIGFEERRGPRVPPFLVATYAAVGIAMIVGATMWVSTSISRARDTEFSHLEGRTLQLAQALDEPLSALLAETEAWRRTDPVAEAGEGAPIEFRLVPDGERPGIIIAEANLGQGRVGSSGLDAARLLQNWAALDLGASTAVALIDSRYRMLLRQPWKSDFANQDISGGPLATAIQAAGGQPGNARIQAVNTDGAERYVAWQPVADGMAFVALGVPIAAVDQIWRDSYGLTLVVYGGLGLALYLALGVAGIGFLRQARGREEALIALSHTAAENEALAAGLTRTPSAVMFVDGQGCIDWANPAFEALTGFPLAEARGKRAATLLHDRDADPLAIARLARARHQGTREQVTLSARRKDGSEFWMMVDVSPVRDEAGRVRYVMAVLSDVSEDQELDALEASAMGLQADFVLGLEADESAHDPGRFLNDVLARVAVLTGSRSGLLSTLRRCQEGSALEVAARLGDIGEEKDAAEAAEALVLMRQAIRTREPARGVVVGVTALAVPLLAGMETVGAFVLWHSGKGFGARLTDRLRDLAASIALSLVTIQALSDQRAARREAVEARRLAEKAANVKGNFLAQMSHDLRTPLNAILGWSEAMSTGAVKLTPERAVTYAQQIHIAGGQLRTLIEEILDLSEAEGGRVGPRRPVPVRPVLAEILHTLRQAAKAKGVTLHIDVPQGDLAVLGDRLALFKLLQNALGNAVSHNRAGGGIWIQARPVGATNLRLDVCDDGPGFPPGRLNRMFQPFHEEYDAAIANRKGFGLGMAIIKATAERMGGSVEAGRAPQGGARISVLLDLAPAQAAPVKSAGGEARANVASAAA